MVVSAELNRLLSLVEFDARLNYVKGLDAFRNLLEKDSDGRVLQFLTQEMRKLEGNRRGGVAFVVAEHYRKTGDLKKLQDLFASEDAGVKVSVLDALWGEPGSNPEMGPGIVRLAIEATEHPAPDVRTQACFVFQNQCTRVDVSGAVEPLRSLLNDRHHLVRQLAACAIGNLAKARYDMSRHIARLRSNLADQDVSVREYTAWAVWQLSRSKHDITAAVPELMQLLTDDDEWQGPRKNAAGALLHHAKKAADNRKQVKRCVKGVRLDSRRKEIKRFLEQLASLK